MTCFFGGISHEFSSCHFFVGEFGALMWSMVLRQVGTISRPEVAGRNAGHITVSLLVNNYLLIFAALCYLKVS